MTLPAANCRVTTVIASSDMIAPRLALNPGLHQDKLVSGKALPKPAIFVMSEQLLAQIIMATLRSPIHSLFIGSGGL